MVLSLANLAYLVSVKPLERKLDNHVEILNEGCILLFYYCAVTLLVNIAIQSNKNSVLSLAIIVITSISIIINIAVVISMTLIRLAKCYFKYRLKCCRKEKSQKRE